ncbi:MAG: hypothetical protein KDA45_05830 [Planctomycetales bacterium]|nr:hypothetical protein [Planctomycetales bacterium]
MVESVAAAAAEVPKNPRRVLRAAPLFWDWEVHEGETELDMDFSRQEGMVGKVTR